VRADEWHGFFHDFFHDFRIPPQGYAWGRRHEFNPPKDLTKWANDEVAFATPCCIHCLGKWSKLTNIFQMDWNRMGIHWFILCKWSLTETACHSVATPMSRRHRRLPKKQHGTCVKKNVHIVCPQRTLKTRQFSMTFVSRSEVTLNIWQLWNICFAVDFLVEDVWEVLES